MSSSQRTPSREALSLHLQRLVIAGLLAALSILCGKYLAIRGGDVLRFSFENLPILLAGFALGPLTGLLVGVVADLVGCLMVGYTINPVVTLGAAAIGLLGGLAFRLLRRLPLVWRVTLASVVAHAVGSVLIKTPGLASYYAMPLSALFLWRTLNYAMILALEIPLLCLLLRQTAIRRSLSRFGML